MSEEDDKAWEEAFSDDRIEAIENNDTSDTIDEPDPESADDSEVLTQKLKSAEGRLQKFEQHIDELREKLYKNQSEQTNDDDDDTPESDTYCPEGWSNSDWEDFSSDYPAQAEIMEKQGRQVDELKNRIEASENNRTIDEQNRLFEQTIRKSHPDYDDLLNTDRQKIVDFIEGQDNPTLKSAYRYIYKSGTAEQIVQLVSDYKSQRDTGYSKSNQSTVNNALAVPGKSQSPRKLAANAGMPSSDDFDASFDYFAEKGIE